MAIERNLIRKTAWVTGASRGIGRAVAHRLANAGAHVVLAARDGALLEGVRDAIVAGGAEATALPLDVSDWAACQRWAEAAREAAGPPDIVVNAAGMGTFRPVDHFREGEFERQFAVNVFGTFYICRLAVSTMRSTGGGHIVNVSSLAGENEGKMGSGYYASKHAVHGFTKCLLQDVRDLDIKVTLVCPGSVDTRFHMDSHPGMHERDQSWMVSPDQVAEAIHGVVSLPGPALVSKIDVRPAKKPQK